MTLADFLAGQSAFIDANTFVYNHPLQGWGLRLV